MDRVDLFTAWRHLRPLAIGFLGAILGVVLTLLAWHVWTDHVVFHDLLTMLQRSAQQSVAPPKAPERPDP